MKAGLKKGAWPGWEGLIKEKPEKGRTSNEIANNLIAALSLEHALFSKNGVIEGFSMLPGLKAEAKHAASDYTAYSFYTNGDLRDVTTVELKHSKSLLTKNKSLYKKNWGLIDCCAIAYRAEVVPPFNDPEMREDLESFAKKYGTTGIAVDTRSISNLSDPELHDLASARINLYRQLGEHEKIPFSSGSPKY